MKEHFVFLGLFLMLAITCFAQGKAMKLAVLEPEGVGLSGDEQWMLSLIQSSITGDFNKYSGITIIDRQNLEAIIAEQKRSLEAMSSDDDEDAIRIGNLANASHVLSGKITKTPNAFMLELAITDVETSVRRASYSPRQVTPSALENLSALKDASADLLKQLGVNLTSSQLAELRGPVSNNQIEAQTALAHGVVAQRQGTSVAALSYYYQAAAFDPSLLEAVNRSSVMSANISSANLGENIRNDIVWRRDWVERLKETEETFYKIIRNATPPYTLFYSTGIETKDINYKTETANLSIPVNLTANGEWFSAMQQALKAAQAVLDGLNATNRKNAWELANWPGRGESNNNPFASYSQSWQRDISVEFELVNQQGKVIGKQTLKLRPSFNISNGRNGQFTISFTENTHNTLTFNAVKADDISDNLTIRPASVNGQSPEAAGFPITAISAEKRQQSLVFRIENGIVMGFSQSLSAKEREQYRDLVIPSEAWGEPVTAIGAKAFENSGLTSVTIPNSITSIGVSAFAGNHLRNITIPNSVTSIGEKVFMGNQLKSVTIPNSVISIGELAFAGNQLKNVIIPNSVSTIGALAFNYAYSTKNNSKGERIIDREFNKITEVTIGSNVKFGQSQLPNQSQFYSGVNYNNKFEQVYARYGHSAGTYIYTIGGINEGWDKTSATKTDDEKQDEKSSWHLSPSFAFGLPVMLNSIDTLFYKVGFQITGSIEFFTPRTDFIRLGLNLSGGLYGIDKDAVRKIHPDVDNLEEAHFFNVGAFMRLYPTDFIYLHGGTSFGYYSSYDGKTINDDKIKGLATSTMIFPVGAGFIFGSEDNDLFIEALYNIAMLKNGYGGYFSINIGGKFGRKRIEN